MRHSHLSVGAAVVMGFLLASMAAAEEPKAAIGAPAPGFSLQDQNGKAVSLADYQGKIVVLEWVNAQCPFVIRHYDAKTMQNLEDKYDEQGVVWLAINSTRTASNESNQKWVQQHQLDYPILNDAAGTVGHAYGAKTTPHMFIVDKNGNLAYMGGIDNDPAGKNPERVNYVQKALDELLAGQSVSTAEAKPYGCSVKYAK